MKIIEYIVYRFYSLSKVLSLNINPENVASMLLSGPFTLSLVFAAKKLGIDETSESGFDLGEILIGIFVLLYICSWVFISRKIKKGRFEELAENEEKRDRIRGHIFIVFYLILIVVFILT